MAETLQGQIRYPNADGTIFGPGCVRERLQEILGELGVQRPFLLTTPSLTRTDLLPAVRSILGAAQDGEFTASRAHTPRPTVLDAAQQARTVGADALISFGGRQNLCCFPASCRHRAHVIGERQLMRCKRFDEQDGEMADGLGRVFKYMLTLLMIIVCLVITPD